MVYFVSSLFVIVILLFETALLPHFGTWFGGSILLLPFMVLMSHKDKTIFPIFLAAVAGIMLDSVTHNQLPVYAISLVFVATITKIFFSHITAYNEVRANLIIIVVGLVLVYALEIPYQIIFHNITAIVSAIGVNTILNVIFLFIFTIIFKKYFDWLEIKTEDRFR